MLRSEGVSSSDPSFTDDLVKPTQVQDDDDEVDLVKQMLFTSIGRENPRPHLLVSLRGRNTSR